MYIIYVIYIYIYIHIIYIYISAVTISVVKRKKIMTMLFPRNSVNLTHFVQCNKNNVLFDNLFDDFCITTV